MDATKKWRPKFGLRALLILVAICAAGTWYGIYLSGPPREVRQVHVGTTKAEALALFGQPKQRELGAVAPGFFSSSRQSSVLRPDDNPFEPAEHWYYRFSWGGIYLSFPKDQDTCQRLQFYYFDGPWHDVDENGSVSAPKTRGHL